MAIVTSSIRCCTCSMLMMHIHVHHPSGAPWSRANCCPALLSSHHLTLFDFIQPRFQRSAARLAPGRISLDGRPLGRVLIDIENRQPLAARPAGDCTGMISLKPERLAAVAALHKIEINAHAAASIISQRIEKAVAACSGTCPFPNAFNLAALFSFSSVTRPTCASTSFHAFVSS